jgi:hypothetical protein
MNAVRMEMGHGVSCKLIFIKIFEVNFGVLHYTTQFIKIFRFFTPVIEHVMKIVTSSRWQILGVLIPFLFGGGHWVKRTWITQRHKQAQSTLLPRFRAQNTNPYVMLV